MLLIRFQALPSVRIAVLFAFRHTDIASRKIPRQAVCLPWEMKEQVGAWRDLTLRLYAAARLLTTAGASVSRYATCEVVAGEHDLEVVGDEGAHEAVRIADFVLRLVRLHHGNVSIRTIRRCGRWAVLLPPSRGKLRLLFEVGLCHLLFLTVRLHASMIPCRIHLTCALVDTNISSVLSAQFATDRTNQVARYNLSHKLFELCETLSLKRGVNYLGASTTKVLRKYYESTMTLLMA